MVGGWPGFRGGWREGEMEKQPHSGAPFDSGCSNITCHEGPWKRLLELVLFADYVHGSFVLLICACKIKLGFIYLLLVLRDEEEWKKERQ